MRLRRLRLWRELSGRTRADLTQLLTDQVATALEGARTARSAAAAEVLSESARATMMDIEHRGDEARARLVTSLASSLVTPLDREDVFRLSRSIDDVLDNLRDFVRELDLFQASDERLLPVAGEIVAGLELLADALAAMHDTAEIRVRILAAKKHCNEIRRAYERQLFQLLQGEVTTGMLQRRELLRRLDVVGLRLGEAVDALADAAIKRGM